MKKIAGLLILVLSAAAWATERSSEIDRVENAATILEELMGTREANIPSKILDNAKCVAVVPSMLKGGFVFGAAYGRGVASCRTDRGWTAPAFFVVEGGSFGFQIGGQAVDLVMLVMNDNGMHNLLSSKFKLGADASVAAGPVGRQAEGSTDVTMRAQILTYSRARGIFAGVTLNGASVRQDRDAARDFYGQNVSFDQLLDGSMTAPQDAQPWITALNRYAGQAGPRTPSSASVRSDQHVVPPPPPPQPKASRPTESDIPADDGQASADTPQQD